MLPPTTNPGSSDFFTSLSRYKYPPFWTLQPTIATRKEQLNKWSSLILSYCRQNRIWRLTLVDALNTPLFHNAQLRKRLTLLEARDIVDWMTKEDGARRAEWIGKEDEKSSAWIYWRRPEEWADVLSTWVRDPGLLQLRQTVRGGELMCPDRSKRLARRTLYLLSMNLPKVRLLYRKVFNSKLFRRNHPTSSSPVCRFPWN